MRRVIRGLSRPYACRWGAPVVDRVDTAIFVQRYFVHCMKCEYCHDSCCQYGADIDVENVARVEAHAAELEQYTGVARDRWWTGGWTDDSEFPGGKQTRTAVQDGACVFRSRRGRGCMLHSFALERGLDYHDLKPMVSSLFPVTFDWGLLHPSNEIADRSLQCIDDGPSLYRGVRGEIEWYFGRELVAELDAIEGRELAGNSSA
jgi:NAD-dependent dihydropyrimidine dehydrogenase PreA subunit